MPAILLALVLGSCQPLDPNLNRLPGTWERVYPENDPLNLYETWAFGTDGKLIIHSEGPSVSFDIPYLYNVDSDGDEPTLKTRRTMPPPDVDGFYEVTDFKIKTCNKTTLVLKPIYPPIPFYGITIPSEITFYRAD